MKAIVCVKYGAPEVLKIDELEKPTPKKNEVLIKIHAATVTMGDCEMRGLKFSGIMKFLMRIGIGFRKPRKRSSILGQELAGEVESIGNKVTKFKKGDLIFGTTGFRFGAYAEYTCLPEKAAIIKKPDNISYEEAATVPIGGLEAFHYLRKANIQEGQTILIRGASGSIGTFAIQLAKYYGAHVTGVGNLYSLEVMKSIGADKVIDYTQEDFTQNGEKYDILFDIIGKSPFSKFENSIKKNGTYLLANPKLTLYNREKKKARKKGYKYISGNMDENEEMLEQLSFLKELIEEGEIKSVIGKRYPLEEVPEAHRFVEEGMKTGNVVITII
jgi:NADPH:quinone reductase-like Zn-dependent oxidoreductase